MSAEPLRRETLGVRMLRGGPSTHRSQRACEAIQHLLDGERVVLDPKVAGVPDRHACLVSTPVDAAWIPPAPRPAVPPTAAVAVAGPAPLRAARIPDPDAGLVTTPVESRIRKRDRFVQDAAHNAEHAADVIENFNKLCPFLPGDSHVTRPFARWHHKHSASSKRPDLALHKLGDFAQKRGHRVGETGDERAQDSCRLYQRRVDSGHCVVHQGACGLSG